MTSPAGWPPTAEDQAEQQVLPVLDEDGLLRFRGRWTHISDRQLPVVALLIRRFGRLVRAEEMIAVYTAAGGTLREGAIHALVKRIRARVGKVGLSLHTVRGRGFVLDAQ